MNPSARLRLAALLGAGVAIVSAFACQKKVDAPLEIVLPEAVRGPTRWIEVGVLPNGCPDAAQLAAGLPATGTLARVAFAVTDPQAPAIGDLPAGTYGFAAVARGEDCTVLAATCKPVDLAGETVRLELTPTDAKAGACASGTVCRQARCVPSTNTTDPSVGADCSLELLGAGPLPNLFTNAEEVVSAPALVAAGEHFLLAYREYSVAYGTARLTVLPIDSGGGFRAPTVTELEGRCLNTEEADATGFAWNGTAGVVGLARAACGDNPPALDLLQVDEAGAVVRQTSTPAPGARSLTLSPAHAVAAGPNGRFYVATVRDDAAVLYTVDDLAITSMSTFGGEAPIQNGGVVTSDKVRALLAMGPGQAPTEPEVTDDAGAVDAEADAEAPDAEPPPAGRTVDLQRVQLASLGDDPTKPPAPLRFEGSWGTLAVEGARTYVVSDGSPLGRGMVFRIFDMGTAVGRPVGYSPPTPIPVLFADATLSGNYLFTFAEQRGHLTLAAFEGALSTPLFKREVVLEREPRLAGVSQVRDGLITVAASQSRVAVAWITAKRFVSGPSTDQAVSLQQARLGGYAVFACRAGTP